MVVKNWYYLTGARAIRRRVEKALLYENLQSKLHAAGSCGWMASRRAMADVIAVFMQSGDDHAEQTLICASHQRSELGPTGGVAPNELFCHPRLPTPGGLLYVR